MLQLAKTLYNIDIVSLRTTGPVGVALSPILNPNNLKIEGWYAKDRFSGEILILPSGEVRERNRFGLAVNDHDAMTPEGDLIRLKKIIDIRFELIKKKVKTESGSTIGQVSDYSYDPESMFIQRLYVTPTGIKSFAVSDKVIGRNQIISINDKRIIVKDTTDKLPFGVKAPANI